METSAILGSGVGEGFEMLLEEVVRGEGGGCEGERVFYDKVNIQRIGEEEEKAEGNCMC